MIDAHHGWNQSFKPVVLGFILSLVFTLGAYRIVVHYHLSNTVLMYNVVGLACVQAILQLIFYLHLCLESKPRWNLITFLFMVLLVIVLVGGSMWIMANLNYNIRIPGEHY